MSSVDWVKCKLYKTKEAIEFLKNELGTDYHFLMCSHMEVKFAAMSVLLKEAGFDVTAVSNLPTSFKKETIAPMKSAGVNVYDNSELNFDDSERLIEKILNENQFNFIFDDGGHTSLKKCNQDSNRIISEYTQSGVNLLSENQDIINSTVFSLNSSFTKSVVGNLYGTGISALSAIQSVTNLNFRGLNVGVIGFGPIGKSCAREFASVGANVMVFDLNKDLKSNNFGIDFCEREKLIANSDLIITCTGQEGVIDPSDFDDLKDGVVLCNVGHYNKEIITPSTSKPINIAPFIDKFTHNNKDMFLLCNGNLINLMAGKGYPIEVIDYSFAASIYGFHYFSTEQLDNCQFHNYPTELDQKYFPGLENKFPKWEDC